MTSTLTASTVSLLQDSRQLWVCLSCHAHLPSATIHHNPEVETAQASSARPAELRVQGSLQMLASAGRWCSWVGSRDDINSQSIPDSPADADHTAAIMSVLSSGCMIVVPCSS